MRIQSYLILLLFLFTFSYGKPVKGKLPSKAPKVQTNTDALKFLDKFGYNQCSSHAGGKTKDGEPLCQSSYPTMIKHFQTVFGLPVSGKLDDRTITLMNKPRCSLGDYPMAYSAFRPW